MDIESIIGPKPLSPKIAVPYPYPAPRLRPAKFNVPLNETLIVPSIFPFKMDSAFTLVAAGSENMLPTFVQKK
jgi:hypothetical protein